MDACKRNDTSDVATYQPQLYQRSDSELTLSHLRHPCCSSFLIHVALCADAKASIAGVSLVARVQQMVADKQPMDGNSCSDVAIATINHLDHEDIFKENAGKLSAGKSWCNALLDECQLTKRECTTQASKLPENHLSLGHRLMLQVSTQDVYCRCNLRIQHRGGALDTHNLRLHVSSMLQAHNIAQPLQHEEVHY